MLTSAIDVGEDHDVSTFEIPGAFKQAEMDEIVHIQISVNG
jgi:hypothetical protein